MDTVACLAELRDTGIPSGHNTRRGALLDATFAVCRALDDGLPLAEAGAAFEDGRILGVGTRQTRESYWATIRHRYFAACPQWVAAAMVAASRRGRASREFLSLAYLYHVLRDRLTHDFVCEHVWTLWKSGTTAVSPGEYARFLAEKATEWPDIRKWSSYSRAHLARRSLASLRDFGLLAGKRVKRIQQPSVSDEAAFHLLCIMLAEGARGRSVVGSHEWRLFLWDEEQVSHALGGLGQRGWVRFEKAGQTVVLELVRRPGGSDGC